MDNQEQLQDEFLYELRETPSDAFRVELKRQLAPPKKRFIFVRWAQRPVRAVVFTIALVLFLIALPLMRGVLRASAQNIGKSGSVKVRLDDRLFLIGLYDAVLNEGKQCQAIFEPVDYGLAESTLRFELQLPQAIPEHLSGPQFRLLKNMPECIENSENTTYPEYARGLIEVLWVDGDLADKTALGVELSVMQLQPLQRNFFAQLFRKHDVGFSLSDRQFENFDLERVQINGQDAAAVEFYPLDSEADKNTRLLIWHKNNLVYSLLTDLSLSTADMIEIAESLAVP